jgi:maltose O-acetyltransferase
MAFWARSLLFIILFVRKTYFQFMTYLFSQKMKDSSARYGSNVHIYYPFTINGMEHLKIGDNVHINKGAYINANGGKLEIGDNVHIGPNLLIYTVNHNYKGSALPYDTTLVNKPVTIGKNVWIGANVTIVPGTTIGDGAIIGAGSVVSGNIPMLAIVASQPPRVIKYRDQKHYDALEKGKHYGGVNGKLYIKEKSQ